MISVIVASGAHSISTSPTSSSTTFPKMVIVFAAVSLLLVFVLVVLSVFAAVRRRRHTLAPKRGQKLSASDDLEAQKGRDISSTENAPPSRGFSALYVWAFSGSSRSSLVGTTGDVLPLPVPISTSSAGGRTLARGLTGGAFHSFFKKLYSKLKSLSYFVACGTNGFFSWRATHSCEADLEAGNLTPRPSFIGEATQIFLASTSNEGVVPEASSPASKYSQPDSPTVETPILGFPIDARVCESAFEGHCAFPLVTDQVEGHHEVYVSNAFVEPPSKDFFLTPHGFGFNSYVEQREKEDRLISAFVSPLLSESLSDCIGDDGDDWIEELRDARPDGPTEHFVETRPALVHANSCTAIVHWWCGSSSSSESPLALEPRLEGIEGGLGHLEVDASFYSCSGPFSARDADDGRLGCDFALSPVASQEVYCDDYG
ncbi:hypothetical protein C8Q79DRAFT_1014854 [Trametes meyenii]|nr:hypothetical protein C8Q79DRAFT_1014854 [Trametes meyenii]